MNDSINEEVFDELKDLLEEKIDEVVQVYLRNAEGYISEIYNAIEHKTPEKVENAAHALKSSSRYFGFELLGELCSECESMAREQKQDENIYEALSALLGRIQAQYTIIKSEMTERGYASP